jgi:small subunit ribosomal protein S6
MRPYESLIIFDAELEEPAIAAVLDRTTELVRSGGGERGPIDRWGKRTFAYEMNHKREGYYVVMEYTAEPPVASEIDRVLHRGRGSPAQDDPVARQDQEERRSGTRTGPGVKGPRSTGPGTSLAGRRGSGPGRRRGGYVRSRRADGGRFRNGLSKRETRASNGKWQLDRAGRQRHA